MNRLLVGAALVSVAFAAALPAAIRAQGEVPLSRVAAQFGYIYAYLGPEDAVALTRPGVTILIRPGERLFDVNDRTESVNGSVPRFRENDVYVSPELVARLRAIAALYPSSRATRREGVNPSTNGALSPAVTGSIGQLVVRQLPGTFQVDVSGTGPARNLPITLTLIGTFSTQIPDTVLNRRQVYTDDESRFRTTLPIAPGYMRGAYLTIVASSVPGVASASLRFEVKAPNGDVSVPAE